MKKILLVFMLVFSMNVFTASQTEDAIIVQKLKQFGVNQKSIDLYKEAKMLPFSSSKFEETILKAIKADPKNYYALDDLGIYYRQIKNNPHIEIASLNSKGQCMRIFGKAVIMENDSVDKIVFEKYPNLKEMYNTEHKQKLGHFYISEGVANLPTDSGTVIIKF